VNEARLVYRRAIERIRQALRAGDIGGIIPAIDALCRSVAWQLAKTRHDVLRDVGITGRQYDELLYGADDDHQQHDRSTPATSPHATPATCVRLSMDKLEAFEALEKTILTASRDDVPTLVGDLARLQAIAFVRLASHNGARERVQPEPDDRLLTAEQAAALLGLSIQELKRRRSLVFRRFRRSLGRRTVRFSESAIKKYLGSSRTPVV
jgi:predicted DNA-binding transcriptional regulator AlpA